MAGAPVLTAVSDGDPKPYVDVLVNPVAGVDSATVWRTVKGRRFKVRGLVGVSVIDGASARDYEAPFGVISSYQVEYFDASGNSTGFSDSATVTLTGLVGSEAWWHDPLDPTSAVKVTMMRGAAAEIVRGTDASTTNVPGRSVGLTFPGTRGGVQGVVLDCYTATSADSEKFDALFGGYDSDALSIVCVCTRPEMWLPPTLFAFVGKPALHPVGFDGEAVLWGVTADETAPPTPAVITPLLTYDDFTAFYSTYDAFTAAYPDYLTASRDYSVKGAS